jgi:hypothetical protein
MLSALRKSVAGVRKILFISMAVLTTSTVLSSDMSQANGDSCADLGSIKADYTKQS